MEKRKLSGKTILKLAGALLALAYLGFYFYVGITGKLPYMHETVHIMRYGDRKKWVAGGMTAAMILGICINSALNDLNLKRIRKESFLPLFFTMIFPIILLLLLEAFLDNGWLGIGIYASVAIFMCATAWIPLILRKWITHLLLRGKPMSGKQQVRIIEWIHFHPLRKLLVFGLWGFGVVLVLRGIWVTATGKIEMDGELFLFLLGTAVLVVALFQKMRRYICTPYRNIPVLNQILSKNQLEQLLDGHSAAQCKADHDDGRSNTGREGLLEPRGNITQDNAEDQGQNGADDRPDGDAGETGRAQGDHGDGGADTQRSDGNGALDGIVVILGYNARIEGVVGNRYRADDCQRGKTQEVIAEEEGHTQAQD